MPGSYEDGLKAAIGELIAPVAPIFPSYHPDAADINEALDPLQGNVASCAVRAYAAGLLIRAAYPNPNLYQVEFGIDPEHGGTYQGSNGNYPLMGHAVSRLWSIERCRIVVETDNRGRIEVVSQDDRHDAYDWLQLDEGYQEYLRRASIETHINPKEVLAALQDSIAAYLCVMEDCADVLGPLPDA